MTDDAENLDGEAGDLTPKEELFCRAFGDPESETFGHGTASAEAARYVGPRVAAWRLRKRFRVIARLREYAEMAAADLGRVMSNIERTRLLAEAKGDHATALRAAELQGKRLGAFVDVCITDAPARRAFTAAEEIEARRLATLLILDGITNPEREALPAPAEVLDGESAQGANP